MEINTLDKLRAKGGRPKNVPTTPPIDVEIVPIGAQEMGLDGMYQLGYNEELKKQWFFLGMNEQEEAFQNSLLDRNLILDVEDEIAHTRRRKSRK